MLTKKNLQELVKDELATTAQEAEAAVNVILEAIRSELEKGESVSIAGFGTFSVVERSARKGINPMTKETIEIPASKNVKFKPASKLKNSVNK